jgi:glutamine amidotransferase
MNATGLDETVLSFAKKGRPILGICVGMQILLGKSLEFGEWDGFNLIPGKVVRIPDRGEDGSAHKIPHIGWNRIFPPSSDDHIWPLTILSDFPHNRMVYFVHSFHAVPKDKNHILAICDYHGIKVTAAVRKENIYGCQFHPEKSGENGLRIFRSFIGLM